ncbi:MAG: hypothetical protein AAB519_03245 [Patescibacteria group bacterium]
MRKAQKGFIAVLTVIALLAFSASLVLSVAYLSIGESQAGFSFAEGEKALHVTEGCAEDAILLAIRDENYTGGTYSYLGSSCTVNLTKEDAVWIFTATGTKNNFSRTIRVEGTGVSGAPGTFTLTSWLES